MINKKKKIVVSFLTAFVFVAIVFANSKLAKATNDFVVGTANLNGTAENSAVVGNVLNNPEIGWKRYDDTNTNIKYTSNISAILRSDYYKGTGHLFNLSGTPKVNFNFTGTKLRIMSWGWSHSYDSKINISIDGVSYTYSQLSSNAAQKLLFEKTGLENREHSVEIIGHANLYMSIDAIDIDETGQLSTYVIVPPTVEATSLTLDKTSIDLIESSSDTIIATVAPDNATNKTIIWSSSDSTVATVDENGYVKALKAGQAVITATVENTTITASCTVNVTANKETITVESDQTKMAINQEFTTDIVIHNGKNIYAEDVNISYNKDLFDYIGYENIDGLKVCQEVKNVEAGTVRFLIASLGENNAVNGDKTLVKLKFKTKAMGKGKVDVTATRIADNVGSEKDLIAEDCGEKEFEVFSDVNNTGDFTLADLGIDAYYYGKNAFETNTINYNADIVFNDVIDQDDLNEISKQILGNSNYTPNN